MGIRKASSLSLTTIAAGSLKVTQAELFEAIVRHLVSCKYGTVQDLCAQTTLSRSTVQARILKHKKLGSRALGALARACGVQVEDLSALSSVALLERIDTHLGKTPIKQTTLDKVIYDEAENLIFNSLFVAACRSGFSLKSTVKLFVAESLKGGVIKAPEPPSGLRISQAFSLFAENAKDALGAHKYVTFCVVMVGSSEIKGRSRIDSHFLALANALRAAYGEGGALVILALDSPDTGDAISALVHLKPIVVRNIVRLDEKTAIKATPEYFVELLNSSIK